MNMNIDQNHDINANNGSNDSDSANSVDSAVRDLKDDGNANPGPSVPDKNAIPLSKIDTSKWNRRYDLPSDEESIESLSTDIEKKGLLSPLSLVPAADGDGYRVLAGGRRLEALRILRGEDGVLDASEYVLRSDLTEKDNACLEIALGDAKMHGELSPRATAKYVCRLKEDLGVDQTKLSEMLLMPTSNVSRLIMLDKFFDTLPEGWRSDLDTPPDRARKAKPAIKLGHWNEVAGKLKDGPIMPELATILTNAHIMRFSTSQLRAEVGAALGEDTQWVESRRIKALENSVRALRSAAQNIEGLDATLAETMLRDAQMLEEALEPAKKAEEDRQARVKEKRDADKAAEKARAEYIKAQEHAAKVAENLKAA